MAKLKLHWPSRNESTKEVPCSKLDEGFQEETRNLPFFPDLQIELSISWRKLVSSRIIISATLNYLNVAGLGEYVYTALSWVEETLAGYLYPDV